MPIPYVRIGRDARHGTPNLDETLGFDTQNSWFSERLDWEDVESFRQKAYSPQFRLSPAVLGLAASYFSLGCHHLARRGKDRAGPLLGTWKALPKGEG